MMDFTTEFEKMRPYNDQEVQEALPRVVQNPLFNHVLNFLYQGDAAKMKATHDMLLQVKSSIEFQHKFMDHAVRNVLAITGKGFSDSGIEKIDPNTPCLFVGNHRDIVLDSAILQSVLVHHDRDTTQITFGSNLMTSPFIVDFGKSNRMFTIYRGGSRIQMYRNALLHSAYMRDAIVNKKESLWIAQRNGRTKDGNDVTQSALIKMFIGSETNPIKALSELNIVPIIISYELEPCDAQKVNEMYHSSIGEYIKAPDEDLKSVINGIISPKGRVHMAFGESISPFVEELGKETTDVNEIADRVAAEIDRQVYINYTLWPFNYMAYDKVNNTELFHHQYSEETKTEWAQYLQKRYSYFNGDFKIFEEMMNQMYAKPVENFLKTKE